ncbi:MAG: bifunctional riboflavin kinase/FAD synthetase [Myxococcota bacterium]|mgnify:CR=1 FL=1
MQTINASQSLPPADRRRVVAIGIFDGVHRGHRALLEQARQLAQEAGIATLAYTFDPHPTRVLSPQHAPLMIEPIERRLVQLAALGIDATLVESFTAAFAATSPEAFVRDILVGKLGVRHVVVGKDFTFGARAAGNVALLARMGRDLDFEVHPVELVHRDTLAVSSTVIRALVGAGDVRQAAELLGRPFALYGDVVHGAGRGATIGLPTANLAPKNELVPGVGVYATMAKGPFGAAQSVTNVGYAPTFDGTVLRVEAHLLDAQPGSLYGVPLELEFLERLRGEQKFSGVEALLAQIAADIAQARQTFASAATHA